MVNNFEFGISIYLSNGYEQNLGYLENAKEKKATFVFTTINMPEENDELKKDISKIVKKCEDLGLKLIVDINSKSLKYVKDYENVYYRVDDGLNNDEIIELTKKYSVVLNSTTLDEKDLDYFKEKGVDFNRLYSLHNYYPKVYTGISIEFLKKRNEIYKKYGLKTMAFIPGDIKREPLFKGLPTVENHRNQDILKSFLELLENDTDVILLGDINLNESNWQRLNYLLKGIVPLRVDNNIFEDKIFENRRDYSDYVIRDKSRNTHLNDVEYIQKTINKGDILYTNDTIKRYEGDLEIALKDLTYQNDGRCIVAKVRKEDLDLLNYLNVIHKFVFI